MLARLFLCFLVVSSLSALSQATPTQDTACPAKLAEWKHWADENIPIYNATLKENEDLTLELKDRENTETLGVFIGIGIAIGLSVLVGFYRRRLAPKTLRGKQAAILIPVALWTSGCFLYQTRLRGHEASPDRSFCSIAIRVTSSFIWRYWVLVVLAVEPNGESRAALLTITVALFIDIAAQ